MLRWRTCRSISWKSELHPPVLSVGVHTADYAERIESHSFSMAGLVKSLMDELMLKTVQSISATDSFVPLKKPAE